MDKAYAIFISIILLVSILTALTVSVVILAVKSDNKVKYGTRVCVQDSTFTVSCHEITRGQ